MAFEVQKAWHQEFCLFLHRSWLSRYRKPGTKNFAMPNGWIAGTRLARATGVFGNADERAKSAIKRCELLADTSPHPLLPPPQRFGIRVVSFVPRQQERLARQPENLRFAW